MNYRIMQEQNRFNAEEAKKNRDWQELMYRMFGTSSAKANDMRAAAAKEKEEKDKVEKENKEFQSRLLEIFK